MHNNARCADERAAHDEILAHVLEGQDRRAHATSSSSGAFQQRESWPVATLPSGGAWLRQWASANGHRAEKRQPANAPERFGTLPGMVASRSRRPLIWRDGASRADRIGVLRGAEQGDPRAPARRSRPHTSPPRRRSRPHHPVVRDQDDGGLRSPRAVWPGDRGSAPGWYVRAVVGSSGDQQRRREHASAMAIMTRWRMPPDSLCGSHQTADGVTAS